MTYKFTQKLAQYLAFIYYYTMLHKMPPAFKNFEIYFGTSPASVNNMIKKLEGMGLITKEKGVARSIRLNIDMDDHTLK